MADIVDLLVKGAVGIAKGIATGLVWTWEWIFPPTSLVSGASGSSSPEKAPAAEPEPEPDGLLIDEKGDEAVEISEKDKKAEQKEKETKALEAQASLPLVKRSAQDEAAWQKKQAEFLNAQRPMIQKEFEGLARSLGIAVSAGDVEETQAAVYEKLGVSKKDAAGVRRIAAGSTNPQAAIYATLLGFQQESVSPIFRVGHANAEKAVMVLKAALKLNMSVDARDLPTLVQAIQADARMKDDPDLKLLIQLSQIQTEQQKDAQARSPNEWRVALLTEAEKAGVSKDSAEKLIAKYEGEMSTALKPAMPAPQPEKQQAETEKAELPRDLSEEELEQKYPREEREQKVAEVTAPLTAVADAVEASAPVPSASSLAASAASGSPVTHEAKQDKPVDGEPLAPDQKAEGQKAEGQKAEIKAPFNAVAAAIPSALPSSSPAPNQRRERSHSDPGISAAGVRQAQGEEEKKGKGQDSVSGKAIKDWQKRIPSEAKEPHKRDAKAASSQAAPQEKLKPSDDSNSGPAPGQ